MTKPVTSSVTDKIPERTGENRKRGRPVTSVTFDCHIKSEACPCCGYPMPSDALAPKLQGAQRQLYEIVRDAGTLGITKNELMTKLYGHRADGGPLTDNIISIMNWQLNKKLRKAGLAIKPMRKGGCARYRLWEVSHEA